MREQKGITLIALVITIIVLLILAGVTIAMLAGENGILGRATDSKGVNAEAQAVEKTKLAYMAVRTEIASQQAIDGNYDPTSTTKATGETKSNFDKLVDVVKNDIPTGKDGWTIGSTGSTITLVYNDDSFNSSDQNAKFEIEITNAEPYAEWKETQVGYTSTN